MVSTNDRIPTDIAGVVKRKPKKTVIEYQPDSDDTCPCKFYNDLGHNRPRGQYNGDMKPFEYQSNIVPSTFRGVLNGAPILCGEA